MKCLTLLAHNLKLIHIKALPDIIAPGESLLVLVCIEEGDNEKDVLAITERVQNFIKRSRPPEMPQQFSWPLSQVIIMPFAHLSEFASHDITHIYTILKKIQCKINSFIDSVIVKPKSTKALFADLAIFDTIITSKFSITEQGIINIMKSLLRIFSADTLQRALLEAKKGGHDNESKN